MIICLKNNGKKDVLTTMTKKEKAKKSAYPYKFRKLVLIIDS